MSSTVQAAITRSKGATVNTGGAACYHGVTVTGRGGADLVADAVGAFELTAPDEVLRSVVVP